MPPSQVFQGMTAAGDVVDEPNKLIRLWVHECLRVFHDRLIDDTDRAWIGDLIKSKVRSHMCRHPEPDPVSVHLPRLSDR